MKRLINLFVVILVVCGFSPGAQSEVYMDYDFTDGVLFQIGGFEVYDVMQRGEVVGEATVTYSELEMMDAPAIRLEWTKSLTSENEETTEIDVDVKMRLSDLKALMSSRIVTVGEQEWRFDGNYTGDNLQFGSYYPDHAERVEASLTRGGRFYDADVLPFLLRNVPFEQGNFITFTTVDVSAHSFITPIASVSGSEIVETESTQYDCWVVKVSIGYEGFTAWYSKNEKHYLVKIRYEDHEVVLNHHS